MSKEIENENLEISEEELYEASVYVKTNGLLEILTEDLDMEARLTLGSNGLPAIDAVINELSCRISYFPVGGVDTDRFILMIRASVLAGGDDADQTARMLACENFNLASVFGTAVFIPSDGSIEYRVSVPEGGMMEEADDYGFILAMMKESISELNELLEDR